MEKSFKMFGLLLLNLALVTPVIFADEDAQFIQSDDVFIGKEAFANQDWAWVELAKQVKAPTPETKQEGQFLQVRDGKLVWTKFIYSTKLAVPADLKLGTLVIAPDLSGEEGIYRAPASKDEARQGGWFIAIITDVSDLYKDYVTVSGGYKVHVKAMRILVPNAR